MSCEELYTRGEAVYIYTSLRGQVCARVIATPSYNNMSGQCRNSEVGCYKGEVLIALVLVLDVMPLAIIYMVIYIYSK